MGDNFDPKLIALAVKAHSEGNLTTAKALLRHFVGETAPSGSLEGCWLPSLAELVHVLGDFLAAAPSLCVPFVHANKEHFAISQSTRKPRTRRPVCSISETTDFSQHQALISDKTAVTAFLGAKEIVSVTHEGVSRTLRLTAAFAGMHSRDAFAFERQEHYASMQKRVANCSDPTRKHVVHLLECRYRAPVSEGTQPTGQRGRQKESPCNALVMEIHYLDVDVVLRYEQCSENDDPLNRFSSSHSHRPDKEPIGLSGEMKSFIAELASQHAAPADILHKVKSRVRELVFTDDQIKKFARSASTVTTSLNPISTTTSDAEVAVPAFPCGLVTSGSWLPSNVMAGDATGGVSAFGQKRQTADAPDC